MARKRVSLKLVSNENARKVTFRKRKQGLVKKMEEITTLCDINGCMVIHNPQENESLIWPSREKAMEMMARYESMPMIDQEIKKVDHEKFMELRVKKLREQMVKREKKNKETRASLIMYQLTHGKTIEDLSIAEVELLRWFSKVKMDEINRQNLLLPPIKLPLQVPSQLSAPPQTPPPPPPPPRPSPLCPPLFRVEPPPPPTLYHLPSMATQRLFIGGRAGYFVMEPPSYHVQNDPFYMNMFGYGGGGVLDTRRTMLGESRNGNQLSNLDLNFGLNPNLFRRFH